MAVPCLVTKSLFTPPSTKVKSPHWFENIVGWFPSFRDCSRYIIFLPNILSNLCPLATYCVIYEKLFVVPIAKASIEGTYSIVESVEVIAKVLVPPGGISAILSLRNVVLPLVIFSSAMR